jgi:hypothetical protein
MSEDEARRVNEDDDVEAHRKGTAAANEESQQDDGDDDFEAHRSPKTGV